MINIVITGIDCVGKSTIISQLNYPNSQKLKFPNDPEIKNQINNYYKVLTEGGKELNNTVINNIYRNIHDLYDLDLRKVPESYDPDRKITLIDRYFIDNIVYSRMNGVERPQYSENHVFSPDLVIMLKVRDPKKWKKLFLQNQKGDENIREPAVLYEEVQREYEETLRYLHRQKMIKKFAVVEALLFENDETLNKVKEEINNLLLVYIKK